MPAAAADARAASTGTGATDDAACRRLARLVARDDGAAAGRRLRGRAPNYARPQMPVAGAVPLRRRPPEARVAGRRRRGAGLRRPDAAGAGSRGHRQQPRSAGGGRRASRRRAPAPASPSRSSTRRSTASPATAVGRRRTASSSDDEDEDNDASERRVTASSCPGSSICSAASGASTKSALAFVLASEQGRRGVLVTLVGDVASNYFLLRELDSAARDRAADAAPQRRDGRRTSRIAWTAACRTGSSSIASAPTGRRPPPRSRRSSSRSPSSRTRSRCCSAVRPDRSARPRSVAERDSCRRRFRRACRRRCSSGGPTSCRPNNCSSRPTPTSAPPRRCSFPTISLTGFLGGVSGDLTSFSAATAAVWSVGAGLLQPIFQAGRLRRESRSGAGAFRRGARRLPEGGAQRLPRGRQLAGDDSEAGRSAYRAGDRRRRRSQDASDLSRARYDSGLASYIEILTADQELFEQQLLLAQTRGAELRARAELYRTLGGGWQP